LSGNVKGEKLFKTKCAACHKVDKKLIGPSLVDALDNWGNDREAMYLWIKNWNASVENGHHRAIEMVNYDSSAMTLFPELTNEDLDNLFEYIGAFN